MLVESCLKARKFTVRRTGCARPWSAKRCSRCRPNIPPSQDGSTVGLGTRWSRWTHAAKRCSSAWVSTCCTATTSSTGGGPSTGRRRRLLIGTVRFAWPSSTRRMPAGCGPPATSSCWRRGRWKGTPTLRNSALTWPTCAPPWLRSACTSRKRAFSGVGWRGCCSTSASSPAWAITCAARSCSKPAWTPHAAWAS